MLEPQKKYAELLYYDSFRISHIVRKESPEHPHGVDYEHLYDFLKILKKYSGMGKPSYQIKMRSSVGWRGILAITVGAD